jgi:hypothetical protein
MMDTPVKPAYDAGRRRGNRHSRTVTLISFLLADLVMPVLTPTEECQILSILCERGC